MMNKLLGVLIILMSLLFFFVEASTKNNAIMLTMIGIGVGYILIEGVKNEDRGNRS